jgi:hypothetical protein
MIMSTGQTCVYARSLGVGNMGRGKGQVKGVEQGLSLPKWIMGARPQNMILVTTLSRRVIPRG